MTTLLKTKNAVTHFQGSVTEHVSKITLLFVVLNITVFVRSFDLIITSATPIKLSTLLKSRLHVQFFACTGNRLFEKCRFASTRW